MKKVKLRAPFKQKCSEMSPNTGIKKIVFAITGLIAMGSFCLLN